ncbi:TetR/AcrR family transcriptional regulator [Crossiella cryophila]|uniref:AcrR family transcriptional regulator n=1 Tax=Crossiella cryophila TaxID=43355 RepID=A0A7W7CDA2_9PSEU|nr:TetR/AcrR family transcriptional regulator [Crossiella cryophila]MBB4679047.1 AcrR family transcriptional regulator [Crossiella cryophila]
MTTQASPRERILGATSALFYRQGIQATGVEELAEAAAVSKRTLYKVFGSKDNLVTAYLEQLATRSLGNEANLARADLSARDRLIALFDRPDQALGFRGCPMHNAAVELAAGNQAAHAVIHRHKLDFLHRLTETAREAGASDPEELGRQLFVLFEGSMALATSLDDDAAFDYGRPAALNLITAATGS